MTLQRDVSPIPAGRYWLTVLGPNIPDFDQWVRDMQGGVRVEASSLDLDASPVHLFVIFNVPPGRAPFLNAPLFGFPNHAPPNVQSVQDVEQAPIIKGPIEELEDFGRGLVDDAKSTATLFGLGLLALAFAKK